MKPNNLFKQISYPQIMATIVLMILGLAFSSLLDVKFLANHRLPPDIEYDDCIGVNAFVVYSTLVSLFLWYFASVMSTLKCRKVI